MKNTEEEMTIEERMKYLRKMQKRYRKAEKKERGKLLNEMEIVTGLHKKSLIRLMGGQIVRKRRVKQRGSIYESEVDDALRVIAESLDYPCAERLQPTLGWMAEHLSRHGEMEVNEKLIEQLGRISISTVQRRIRYIRQDQRRLLQKGPEHTNRLMKEIPAGRIAWDEPQPGHFEADLVHHSGSSSSGQIVHTLQLIDVLTGWSERVASLEGVTGSWRMHLNVLCIAYPSVLLNFILIMAGSF